MSDKDARICKRLVLKQLKNGGPPCGGYYGPWRVQAFPEAQALGKELGVKVIYGVEGYLIEDETVIKMKSLY